MNFEQEAPATATRALRRTGSGRRAAHVATERTTMQYLRTQREMGGAPSTSSLSGRSSPWSGAADGGSASATRCNDDSGNRCSRKSKSASHSTPSRTAALAASSASGQKAGNSRPVCPFACPVDVHEKILQQAMEAIGDKLAANKKIEEYYRPFMIRPLKQTSQDLTVSAPSPSPLPQEIPPAWILEQFREAPNGTPSPPPIYARSLLSLHGHASPCSKTTVSTSSTRSSGRVSPARAPSPRQTASHPPHPPPEQLSAPSSPQGTVRTQSLARQPPPATDPPSPWQVIQCLDLHSDTDDGHWLPAKSAPSGPRTSLFDLASLASQPQTGSRTEVVDLSDSDDEVQAMDMEDSKVMVAQGRHSSAANRKCELVDVIDSDIESDSDRESAYRQGRVLVNGLFDSPDLDLDCSDGQDDGGGGPVVHSVDIHQQSVSHRSCKSTNQYTEPGLGTTGMQLKVMDDALLSSHHRFPASAHAEPFVMRSTFTPDRTAPPSLFSPCHPPPPSPPQQPRNPPASLSTNAAATFHPSPIHIGDSDSDIEFVGETSVESHTAPEPHATARQPPGSSARAPTLATSIPPAHHSLARIFQARKPMSSKAQLSDPASRALSRGSSPLLHVGEETHGTTLQRKRKLHELTGDDEQSDSGVIVLDDSESEHEAIKRRKME